LRGFHFVDISDLLTTGDIELLIIIIVKQNPKPKKSKPDLGLSFGTCSRTVVKFYSFEEPKARTGFLVPSMYGTRTNIFGKKN
jgi:hypothetical protein